MNTRTLALAALAAAVLSASPFPAMAAPEKTEGLSVAYGDLDLNTDAGRAELSRRFDDAARKMCGVADGQAPKGSERYCYKAKSAQFHHFALDIIAHPAKKTGLAER